MGSLSRRQLAVATCAGAAAARVAVEKQPWIR